MNAQVRSFSFIVVGYKSRAHIEACLKAIIAHGPYVKEILLWANDHETLTLKKPWAHEPRLFILGTGDNLGFAAGNNRCAASATSDWLILVNPDAFIAPDFCHALDMGMQDWPDARIFGVLQRDAKTPSKLDGAGDGYGLFGFPYRMGIGQDLDQERLAAGEVFSACGAGMVIKRDLFHELGGFDEAFFCYCEDSDLGYRARLKGEVSIVLPKARLDHVGSASLGLRSDFAVFHGYRNRIWLFVKNTPLLLLVATAPVHIMMTLVLLFKDIVTGRAKPSLSGIWAALIDLGRVIGQRRAIAKTRRVSIWGLLAVMTLNPFAFLRRAIKIRTLKP